MTALITVQHREYALEDQCLSDPHPTRYGVDLHGQITYEPEQMAEALQAVDRLAHELRRQIADAAESRSPE